MTERPLQLVHDEPGEGLLGSTDRRTGRGHRRLPSSDARVSEQLALAYGAGIAPKARSQWAYARIRFFRHKLAVISLVVLILIGLVALFADRVAPYAFDELDLNNIASAPDDQGPSLLRHRSARPRLSEPGHLRPSHLTLGRALRRRALDR